MGEEVQILLRAITGLTLRTPHQGAETTPNLFTLRSFCNNEDDMDHFQPKASVTFRVRARTQDSRSDSESTLQRSWSFLSVNRVHHNHAVNGHKILLGSRALKQ
jgi:hypothetical protein